MCSIFCVILLKNCSKFLIVKSDAIDLSDFGADDSNWGWKSHIVRKFFVSPFGHRVDFSTPIQENFDENNDSCYEGYILRSFGESYDQQHNHKLSLKNSNFCILDYLHLADAYMRRKRGVVPVNYSEIKKKNRIAEIDIKVERIERMQNTIVLLNNRLNEFGPVILTEDEISESVNILLNATDDPDIINVDDNPTIRDDSSTAPGPTNSDSNRVLNEKPSK